MVSPAFLVRLSDLLTTLESAELVATAEVRVRGLGEQLTFACKALPCSEALVAIELGALGRLRVPCVATQSGYRTTDHELLLADSPLSALFAGNDGYAVDVSGPDDPSVRALGPVLSTRPGSVLFVPIRVAAVTIGGAVLLSERRLSDGALDLAQHLGEVLALTVESFRTECLLYALFSRALPDVLGADAATSLPAALRGFLHQLSLEPRHARHVELALETGRIAARGAAEGALVLDVLRRFDRYFTDAYGAAAEPRP